MTTTQVSPGLINANNAAPAGTLTGTEIALVSRGAGFLKTTTSAIASLGSSSSGVSSFDSRTGAVTLQASDITGVGGALLASPTFTGTPLAPTAVSTTNSTQIATTSFVKTAVTGLAPLASPTFTGTPAAPTATAGTNTTQIATTGFVTNAISSSGSLPSYSTSTSGQALISTGTSTAPTWQTVTVAEVTGAAPLASPTFTGIPASPTPAVSTNTTQIATTAFVIGQAGNATPVMNGTAAVGVSTLFSRQDHVHPTDTSRAALASPTFTGVPAAPTATAGTNTTQISTTAFVGTAITGATSTLAPLNSPNFTGTPIAPTATAGTSTTQIATTAFVANAVSSSGALPSYATSTSGQALVSTGPSTAPTWQTLSSGGGLADFTDTLSTASPNSTTWPAAALVVTSSTATSADASIVPLGTGAFQLAIPDGTAVGGNKRGANAIDLQTTRTQAAQVASGSHSVLIGGPNSTSSGVSAVAIGSSNFATSNYSTAIGYGNTSSGVDSTVIGYSNTASSIGSTAIGYSNVASGGYATAIGYQNAASATYSTALGTQTTASGFYSLTAGRFSTTNGISGQVAFGFASQVTGGKFQRTLTQLFAITTSTTATTATADGATAATANQLTLRTNSAYRVRLYTIAWDVTNGTDAKEWTSDILITRGATAAATAIVGAPTVTSTFATAGASGWTLAVSADTTYGALKVTVTSSTTDTVDWNIQLDAIEVM